MYKWSSILAVAVVVTACQGNDSQKQLGGQVTARLNRSHPSDIGPGRSRYTVGDHNNDGHEDNGRGAGSFGVPTYDSSGFEVPPASAPKFFEPDDETLTNAPRARSTSGVLNEDGSVPTYQPANEPVPDGFHKYMFGADLISAGLSFGKTVTNTSSPENKHRWLEVRATMSFHPSWKYEKLSPAGLRQFEAG